MSVPLKPKPAGIEYRSGWEKYNDSKTGAVERARFNGRLFCILVSQGRTKEFTPYGGRWKNGNQSSTAA